MRRKIKNICSMVVVSMTVCSVVMTTTLNKVVVADEIETYQEVTMDEEIVEKNTEMTTTENQQESETKEETIGEETKAEESKEAESQTPSISESETVTTKQELTEEELGEKNHTNDEFGIKVISENLPWYVKLVVEETDTEPFWDAYNSDRYTYSDDYWGEKYEDDDYEYDEDTEEYEDDYDEGDSDDLDDDEDEYEDDENEDSDELDDDENVEDEDETEDENKDFILKACKISFADTRNNEEYSFSEGEKIVLSTNIEYTNGNEYAYYPEVLKMQKDGTVEFLYRQNADEDSFSEELEDDDYDGTDDEKEQVEDEEWDNENGNEYNTDYEYEDGEENDERRTYQVEENIKFSVTEKGEYAVLMRKLMYKTCASNESIKENVHYEQPQKRSPKTGTNLKNFIVGEIGLILMMGFAAMNFVGRRKINCNSSAISSKIR